MTKYKYFQYKDGRVARIRIEQDDYPLNPRYDWDGNVGKMMCWHRDYKLGDYKENDYKDPEDFVNALVREHVSEKTIINFIKAKKASNKLELKYNRKNKEWDLLGYWTTWWDGNKVHYGVIAHSYPLTFLIDDIIESMSFKDKWELLERKGIVYLPLYLYDHSGITMSCGAFSCPWDSGQVGYIYTDKKTILKMVGKFKNDKGNYVKATERNWKECAYIEMRNEVNLYDTYIRGDCYGYVIEEFEDNEWTETDSCWGFLTDKWGDALYEEMMESCVGNYKLHDDLTAVLKEREVCVCC